MTIPVRGNNPETWTGNDWASEYPDNGCRAAVCCVECPLLFCKHDDPTAYRAFQVRQRYQAIAARVATGLQSDKKHRVEATAKVLGITERTVWRALSAARRE
jgi:hypothetical protein|tara:strand:+ start:3625 stop:3930 length:306 start_codon:yes stop_codon:yes gene_type:complete